MNEPKPEAGVEYAAVVTSEFAEARSLSAVASLAAFLGVTEHRAVGLLADPAAYCAEVRRRQSPASRLRRTWRPGYPSPYSP